MKTGPQRATRNLVILRAGNNSLHREWLQSSERDFDLFISYYGQEQNKYHGDAEYHEMRTGPKWPCIKELLSENADLINRYDSFWFPDDDISASTQTINRLFGFFRAFDLSLAQPALTADSYYSWPQLVQKAHTLLRYVDFVELMVPIFSRDALKTCLNTFDENRSGWGIDWVWPKLINNTDKRHIAIIDATSVKHTRPLGGELYKNNPEMDPANEAGEIFSKYKISDTRQQVRYVHFGTVEVIEPSAVDRIVMTSKVINHKRKRRREARKAAPKG